MRSLCRLSFYALSLCLIILFLTSRSIAQASTSDKAAAAKQETQTPPGPVANADSSELAKIDWFEEAKKGGITMLALGVLSIAALAFFVERLITLRIGIFAPRTLRQQLAKYSSGKNANLPSGTAFQSISKLCQNDSSTLGRSAYFVAQHHDQPFNVISSSVSDIAGRDIRNQIARTTPLAVIAALAPLLGLLGTMIGMIESFKLVSIYGDDGGASMLADSIAKALITTAGGLVLAIPSLAAYHFFRHRINGLTNQLETELDGVTALVLNQDAENVRAKTKASPKRNRPAENPSRKNNETKEPVAPVSNPSANS